MRPSFFYYCIHALGFHPTKEPISAKAKVAHNQRQEKKNGGAFFAFAKEDLPQKKSRMGSRKTTILVRTYASKPIRRVINRSRRVIERKIIHLRRKKTTPWSQKFSETHKNRTGVFSETNKNRTDTSLGRKTVCQGLSGQYSVCHCSACQ